MSEHKVHRLNATTARWCAIVFLIAAVTAAYANHFPNSFHFDDSHTIENNAAIRSLGNVPRFFSDASMFSALPSNQSYRPLVSTLLAVDYRLGGGLKPFVFHFSVFAPLFAIVLLIFPDEAAAGQSRGRRMLSWLKNVVPTFVICGAVLVLVQRMTPHTWIAGAANARNYLITQPYVALLYFLTFFWPANLSADYDLAAFISTDDGRFWIGFLFLIVFTTGSILASWHRRTRVIGFGLLWFLVALLPTSLFPLAEVMNDHRTFFPYVGLTIALAGVGSVIFQLTAPHPMLRKVTAVAFLFLILPMA